MTSEYVCDHYQYYVGCWKPKHGIYQNIFEAVVMSLWPVRSLVKLVTWLKSRPITPKTQIPVQDFGFHIETLRHICTCMSLSYPIIQLKY